MVIRQHDGEKNRTARGRIRGFPSSHDIFLSNIDDYMAVLGKLLRAGDEVLIVSKPVFKCIYKICAASAFFKDKILFRFTIGANNDEILSFWEPNAPSYENRKRCLEYAFNNGFRTSVSIEPMLDAPNVEALVKDLLPFVSEDLWLGPMNHRERIKKQADAKLLEEIETIERNQSREMLTKIYNTYKKNPKIKFKHSFLEMIGLGKVVSLDQKKQELSAKPKKVSKKASGKKKAARA